MRASKKYIYNYAKLWDYHVYTCTPKVGLSMVWFERFWRSKPNQENFFGFKYLEIQPKTDAIKIDSNQIWF